MDGKIKILAIGNSFSVDATEYLYQMATAGGKDVIIGNAQIGGCSLERHWNSLVNDIPDYDYIENTVWQPHALLREKIAKYDWDIITLQQCSHFSGLSDTYNPYLEYLAGYIRKEKPDAKLYIHKTWAYEVDSTHPDFPRYGRDQQKMYEALSEAYGLASKKINAPLIPSGDVIQALRETPEFDYRNGGLSLCRDGFHMHLFYGRYAVAATWYETLAGGNILENPYLPPENTAVPDPDAEKRIEVIKRVVHGICSGKRN